MIEALKKFSPRSIKVVTTGLRHVFPESSSASVNLDEVKPTDPQAELRTYLDGEKHAIFYPRP